LHVVPGRDQVKKRFAAGFVHRDVAQLVKDDEVVALKAFPVSAQLVAAHGFLEFRDKVGDGGEEDVAAFHAGVMPKKKLFRSNRRNPCDTRFYLKNFGITIGLHSFI
jgi:hypothetical protein